MNYEIVDNILNINMTNVGTLAIAMIMLSIGYVMKRKVKAFEKFCIPAPVIGGLIFAIINFLLWQTNTLRINLDTSFQSPFMIAFFVTVGLGASFKMLKKGGKLLVIYWLLCGLMDTLQNALGVLLTKLGNIAPIYGIMAGSVALSGGHSGAASFGQTAELMGHEGAIAVAMAAATYGLVAGSLLGGPIAKRLIEKNNLKSTEDIYETKLENIETNKRTEVSVKDMMRHITVITVIMTIGSIIGDAFSDYFNFFLPGYVGAMFLAVIVRNINEKYKLIDLDIELVNKTGDVCLAIFLSLALISLRIWELLSLALPMIIILAGETIFMIIFIYFFVFKCLGSDFDAAVMCAGMAGHGLGATPNAIANMDSVIQKYGMSRKAFMVVPIVGAFLVDILAIPETVWFINFFG